MQSHLMHSVPSAIGVAMLVASIAILVIGRRHGLLRSRRTVLPAAYVGIHGLVGIVLAVGRQLALPRGDVGTLAATLDVLGLLLLALVVVDADHVARTIREELARSRERASEYERARLDYERIMRHRLGNPLAIVTGGVETIRSLGDQLDPAVREELLGEVAAAARRLEQLAIDPAPRTIEERGLDGRVRVSAGAPILVGA